MNEELKGSECQEKPHEATCPNCGHKFLHKIHEGFKETAESLGNAIGEAAFGGERQ